MCSWPFLKQGRGVTVFIRFSSVLMTVRTVRPMSKIAFLKGSPRVPFPDVAAASSTVVQGVRKLILNFPSNAKVPQHTNGRANSLVLTRTPGPEEAVSGSAQWLLGQA